MVLDERLDLYMRREHYRHVHKKEYDGGNLGSTIDQAFQTMHNIFSLTTTSEHTFFDKSKGSTLSSKRFQSGNKNIRSSSVTKLPDTKKFHYKFFDNFD